MAKRAMSIDAVMRFMAFHESTSRPAACIGASQRTPVSRMRSERE